MENGAPLALALLFQWADVIVLGACGVAVAVWSAFAPSGTSLVLPIAFSLLLGGSALLVLSFMLFAVRARIRGLVEAQGRAGERPLTARDVRAALARFAQGRNVPLDRLQLLMEAQHRDFGPDDYERLLALDDDTPTKRLVGARADEISVLPVVEYRARRGGGTDDREGMEGTDCKICLEPFEEGERLRLLPCLHRFHETCADKWLVERAVCPVCKWSVRDAIRDASAEDPSLAHAAHDMSADEHFARQLAAMDDGDGV
jgi:Ring finger domain